MPERNQRTSALPRIGPPETTGSTQGLRSLTVEGHREASRPPQAPSAPLDAHPIVAEWIDQLRDSAELATILARYETHKIDVTLSASNGRAVLRPKISIR